MPCSDQQAIFDRRLARNFWRLMRVYRASPAARKGVLLLALAVTFEFSTVYGNVLLTDAQRRVFDVVQDKQMSAFFAAMRSFFATVLVFVLVSAYRIYVRQWLEMHWRQSVTARYLERWIGIFMDDATAALDEAMEKRVADGKGCRGHA